MSLPPIAYISEEADVHPRNHPDRAEDIDFAIGELSSFHETFEWGLCGFASSRTFNTVTIAARALQRKFCVTL
jgi:hypothetical protein